MTEWLERTELLLGKEKLEKLQKSNVLVVGLGGVGACAAEMICRAGIGSMTIVDGDKIQPSNRNRQLHAMSSTQGKSKALLMNQRLKDINPVLKLNMIDEYIKDNRMIDILKADEYDYVVDAIDTLSPKVYLLYHCVNLKLNIISSMGSGGKADPTKIEIADISKSYNCRLAFILRKRLRKLGVSKGIKVVFSKELTNKEAVIEVEGEENKQSTTGTISYMPPLFGCFCAHVVINDLIKN